MSPTSAPPTKPLPQKSRRPRWSVVGLAFLAFLILGVFATKVFFDWRLHINWDDAEAEADLLDPGWRLEEVLARITPIADDQNSALLLREIAANKPGAFVDSDIGRSKLFNYYPPTARYSEEQSAVLENSLAKSRDKIEPARRLKDMVRGHLTVTDFEDLDAIAGRNHIAAHQVVSWLKWDAKLLAHQGQFEKAAESCLAIRNVAHSMEEAQGYMVVATQNMCFQSLGEALERVLAQGQLTNDMLQGIQRRLEEDAQVNLFLRAVRGERVYSHRLFENVRDGKLSPDKIRGYDTGKVSFWWHSKVPSAYLHDYPDYLREMNQLVELAKLPIHEQRAEIGKNVASARIGSPFNNLVLASRQLENFYCQVWLRTTSAAIACERYRLSCGKWPQSLDVLVKEKYLAELPLDPRDGKPMRFRTSGDGIVIYSIGNNAVDEQGNMRRHGFAGASDDQGFRLWNEKSRGQAPVPPVELKKKKA